jgi:glycosyltransferase involved in cell wall biosynthesis
MASLSLRARKIDVFIVGIGELSDSYPNYKYKHELITKSETFLSEDKIFSLGSVGFWNMAKSSATSKFVMAIKFIWFSFCGFCLSLTKRTKTIYVFYPSIIISLFFCLVPRALCPKIVLDAFISIYDTTVIDRRVVAKESVFAKLIFRLEQLSFWRADTVIVDTELNAEYYAKLYGLERSKFVVVPLSIPKLGVVNTAATNNSPDLNVFFFGTFVPLHGVSTIIEAAKTVMVLDSRHSDGKVKITIVGDGQDGQLLEDALKDGLDNVKWIRTHCNSSQLAQLISDNDLMLGVFAENDKTRRVVPYKHYYYLCIGKPIVTARTPAIELLDNQPEISPFLFIAPGSANELAEVLLKQKLDKANLKARETAAQSTFDEHLSIAVIEKKLRLIFC